MTTDQTSNALSETTTVDPMVNDKSDQDETTTIERSSTNNESTELDNRSSLSLVDLVETIFSKKEIKPIDQVPKNMNEESLNTRNSSQDRPESDILTNNPSEELSINSS